MSELLPQPKVSIITPLYNSALIVRPTLESIIGQTYQNWESILVDDGSSDDTARVVEPYLTDPRFRYVSQKNQGIAGARNTGILAATGEWICLLDHDDRWLPEKLEKQIRFALEHRCDLVGTNGFIVHNEQRFPHSADFPEIVEQAARSVTDPSIDVFGLMLKLNFMCTCSVMIRRSLFERFGLFDSEAAPVDDYEMWIRCLPEIKLGFINEPLVEYLVHDANFSRNEIRMHEKAIYALRKTRPRHANDRQRRRQFDQHLLLQYTLLFERLGDEHMYDQALRHSMSLVASGIWGWRILPASLGAFPRKLLRRIQSSIRYRLGLNRAL
ncbi:MAG TPA: glycosyltransferase [Pyrinomonadaceae bacterium]|nr:glycosyltransferase [Pyrinomonadaceae bacterium]